MFKKKISYLVVMGLLTLPLVCLAMPIVKEGQVDLKDVNPLAGTIANPTDPFAIMAYVIQFLLSITGTLAFGAFIWGGVHLLTSAGNSKRVERGKEILKWATLGVIFSLIGYGILRLIIKIVTGAN